MTTNQVKPLLEGLKQEGWEVPKSDALISKLVPTGSYLDRTFSTKNGKKFFRQISNVPGGIDRVDRMSKLNKGKSSINQLVNEIPNGADFVKALATTRGGKTLGNWTSRARNGQNFNQTTGKIYTEKELTKELVKRFKEDLAQKQRDAN